MLRRFPAPLLLALVTALAAQEPAPDLSILTRAGTPFADGDSLICFGDSITQFGDSPNGYVTLLRQAFATAGHPLVKVINSGIGGQKVPGLQARLERDVLSQHPTVVFIYIGINDVWHHGGDLGAPKTAFEAGLRDIIGKIQAHGGVVVLATPTVIGEKPDGGNQLDAALDKFAEASRTIAKENDVELCDLRKAFVDYLKAHNAEGKDKGVLTVDGVHLNPTGDALVASEAAKSLVAGLPRGAVMPVIDGGDFVGQAAVTISFRARPEAKGLVARYTLDGSEPTAASPAYDRPLGFAETTTVKAHSFRGGAAVGATATLACRKLVTHQAHVALATVPGLAYAYYEGSFPKLPDFATLTPAGTGAAPGPDIAVVKRDHDYALRFTGFLTVPTDALYDLGLSSDDGSRLTLDDQVVIDNDGAHGMGAVQSRVALQAGLHACTIDFFQAGGNQGLELTWSAPGLPAQPIPASAFVSAKKAE